MSQQPCEEFPWLPQLCGQTQISCVETAKSAKLLILVPASAHKRLPHHPQDLNSALNVSTGVVSVSARRGRCCKGILTVKRAEVLDQVDVTFFRIRSDGLHLGAEVWVERVALVHDSDDKHLDSSCLSLGRRYANLHHVPRVGLAVR